MRKKSTTPSKKEADALLPNNSLFDFVLKGFNNNTPPSPSSASASTRKKKIPATKSSALIKPTANVSSPSLKSVNSISDLKDLVSSRSESLKRHLDLSHAEVLKEFEASGSRISKRFKMQAQTCQQMMDEANKEYKRLADLINENMEAMKTSYAESITKVEASTNRLVKTSIPELAQSMEKAIEGLRNSYGIPMNAR